ncbi:MAG TPA: hypothetical protein VLH16_05130, partial [Bacteroidales bacterium]|nr:hypothetical protein [Bacteroidales bacterium]
METITATYSGHLRTVAVHLTSGAQVVTDAPVDNQGKGESFSPTDLVVVALGNCILTIMGIAGRSHAFDIEGTKLRITKIMESNPRRIGEIVIDIDFPPLNYTEKQKQILRQC